MGGLQTARGDHFLFEGQINSPGHGHVSLMLKLSPKLPVELSLPEHAGGGFDCQLLLPLIFSATSLDSGCAGCRPNLRAGWELVGVGLVNFTDVAVE